MKSATQYLKINWNMIKIKNWYYFFDMWRKFEGFLRICGILGPTADAIFYEPGQR